MIPLYCFIATSQRPALLRRLLGSIAGCDKPENFRGVVVADNGPRSGSEEIVRTAEGFETYYFYFPEPNKSRAMNYVLRQPLFSRCAAYFLDDDMRLDKGAIVAMARAITEINGPCYLGGPVGIDYEQEPGEWLKPYLPFSARGWCLDSCQITPEKYFLGGNWLAFSDHIRQAGGFPEDIGPGRRSVGEETYVQGLLMDAGVAGYYVPLARVWHYVPVERCSPQWAGARAYSHGVFEGMTVRYGSGKRIIFVVKTIGIVVLCLLKWLVYSLFFEPERAFGAMMSARYQTGVLRGLSL